MPILQSDAVVEKKKKKKEKNKKTKKNAESKPLQRSLSGLPDDVLRLILKRLNWVDRIRFCLVSNDFPRLLQEIPCQPADKLPWLFHTSFGLTSRGRFRSRCDLCPPFSERTYSVRIMDQEARTYLRHAIPFASSSGWVLLLRHINWEDYESHYFSLYRPYNNRFVKLPKLDDCNNCFAVGRAAIYVDQTSSSSVSVFYACLNRARCTIILSMCKVGATDWKKFKFPLPGECREVEAAFYSDGFVYCILDHGSKMVIFDVLFQDWKFLSCGSPYGFDDYRILVWHFLFNGELVKWDWTGARSGGGYSWRFDKSLKKWVQQESLGDLTLFPAQASIFPVMAVGELSSYATSVHTLTAKNGIRYTSLITGKYNDNELYPASNCSLLDFNYYCWIEPPLLARN